MILRSYQEIGAAFLAERKAALLGDTMGLGKTAQYLAAAERVRGIAGRVLVLAPEATLPGLKAQVKDWLGLEATILGRSTPRVPSEGYILLGYTSVHARRKELLAGPVFSVLILDEAHRVKSGKAKVTRAALMYKDASLADRAERIWAITGTPIPNRPIELQALLFHGFALPWANRQQYGDRYCRRRNRFAPFGYDYLGANNLDELRDKLREAGILLRRTADDVPGELPDLQHQVVPLAVPEVRCELDREAILSAIGRGAPVPVVECSKYRADMGKAKLPALLAWLREWLEDHEEALVVFAWHREVAEALAKELPDAMLAHGDIPPVERQLRVRAFAEGKGRVFVGTIGACGVGLNGLHKRTNCCAFAELPWCPGELEQAVGRVRRIGSVGGPTLAMILVGEDSLEAHILQVILRKLRIAAEILGD